MDQEQDALRKLMAGSYKDFTRLYEEYAPRLYAFVLTLTHSETVAQDIVQETFLKVWLKRDQIDPSCSFKSWLFTIARNHLLNEFRNRLNRTHFLQEIGMEEKELLAENNVELNLSIQEFNQALEKAKEKLTPRQRELFEWNREQGVPVAEIAARISVSEQSVRNQLSQAVVRLREELKSFSVLFLLFFFH